MHRDSHLLTLFRAALTGDRLGLHAFCDALEENAHPLAPFAREVAGATADVPADLDAVYSHIRRWATSAMINHDPVMPAEVRGRLADNWRSLIAVADACSPAWGALTREPAVAFSKSCHDEDILVVLLQHSLEVFDACGVDRLASKTLVDALVDMIATYPS